MKKLITGLVGLAGMVPAVLAGGASPAGVYVAVGQNCNLVTGTSGQWVCAAAANAPGYSIVVVFVLVAIGIYLWQKRK